MRSDKFDVDRRTFVGATALATGGLLLRSLGHALAQEPDLTPGATVETTSGKIRGLLHNNVQTFRGVPYGASTAGAGRFRPPVKPQPWTGVRDAFTLGPRAPQFYGGEPAEMVPTDPREGLGEDCLVVNVWTPAVGAGQRPVMVWLHGGGFASGSAGYTIYDGTELARKHDVVLVGVNHRLNVFGFLYLTEIGPDRYADASNAGILDLVAALEWVRDNIAAFGGNPNRVTIFGQSGGGAKVSTLMAMPAAKGLFHRAIVQSGSYLTGVSVADATKTAETVLSRLSLDRDRLNQIEQLPMERVLEAVRATTPGGGVGQLAPVVDGRTLPSNPFEPSAPAVSAGVPLMIGSTETEVTFFPYTSLDPVDEAGLRARVQQALRVDEARAARVIAIYRTHRPKAAPIDVAILVETDASTFRRGVDTQAERKVALGAAAVYMYRFRWYSPVREGKLRAMHCMEIPFVFDNVDAATTMTGTGKDRHTLAARMSAAWVAFARNGHPNHSALPRWAAFDPRQRSTMMFDTECRLINDPYREERLAVDAALGGRV